MRTLLLSALAVIACNKSDGKKAAPTAPSKPVDKATFDQIAHLPYGEARSEVLNAADTSMVMKVVYEKSTPKLSAELQVSRCTECVEINLPKWEARKDALRALEAPSVKDLPDTVYELGETTVAGRKVIFTHTAGVLIDPGKAYTNAHNYCLYWNDGVNQITIRVKDADLPSASTVPDLLAKIPREKLGEVAGDLFTKIVAKLPAR